MNIVLVARIGAVVSSAITVSLMVMHGSFQYDNPFLFPDLALSALLLIAALSPGRFAPVLLLTGFSLSVGVFMTAAATQIINNEPAIATIGAAIASVAGILLIALGPLKALAGR